ncbi:zinc-binding alcohol dehydrogenase [Agromyces atrinae]|uniref:Zinc-binding alcohol dehydrogenase n=1 Tax=Agromyces atrinae TaxID=592376 RepID=A0A4Q2M1C8_9MICO|nr:zinc-binding alcohol dehydrogenase [Agromyces atrinae]NYD68239.1 hypothetical protein [Agromyces atrinae]RXZ85694.1 zinc-binding alcohol dehydrogenase [Agromyces atrinae]
MHAGAGPSWVVRENASRLVLLALYLRDRLGIASPTDLPRLRGVAPAPPGVREVDVQDLLERQWRSWWMMTVEPEAHPSPTPLALLESYGTDVALPIEGAELLAQAITPFAAESRAWAERAAQGYPRASGARHGDSYRAYAGTIAEHEREVGRRAHSFELNVEVLPFTERGVWWIGSLTIAVTDALRADPVAFDAAIHPIIAELA